MERPTGKKLKLLLANTQKEAEGLSPAKNWILTTTMRLEQISSPSSLTQDPIPGWQVHCSLLKDPEAEEPAKPRPETVKYICVVLNR